MKRKSNYQKALASYNRTAGQLKRYYDVDPQSYLEGVHTQKGVERALRELRREAERQQVERAVEQYEKYTRTERSFKSEQRKIQREQAPRFYFDEEKQRDYEERLEQYERGRQTFEERYGSMDGGYDRFVSFIGALPDEYKGNETFGSKNIVEAWRTAQELKLSDDQMLHVMIDTLNSAEGQGLSQAEILDDLYSNMREAAQ